MRTQRVAVDWDSTLAATDELVLSLLNFKHGTSYTKKDLTDYKWHSHLRGRDGETLTDDFWKVFDLMETHHLRRAIRPVSPFACATVKWLQRRGHVVDIVTANTPMSADSIRAWLFGHGVDAKVVTLGRVTAAAKARMNYDLFIDDSPALVHAVVERGVSRMLLVNQPWNRFFFNAHYSSIRRVRWLEDWKFAAHILETEMNL